MRKRTNVQFTVPCDDPTMIQKIQKLGAQIEYHTERTLTFVLEGSRMILGHNWENERYVSAISSGHTKSKALERIVKEAIEA